MRLAPCVAVLMMVPLGGCSGVQISRGLPVLAKEPGAVLISGAEGLPDIERGNQARLAGRLDDAERDLLPLAQRGYTDAQLYLAAVYAEREALEWQDEAIKWYRTVLPRRPDAAVPLARVLMRRGDRASVLEAGELLLTAQDEADKEIVGAALLDLYSLFPALDVKKKAPALALAAGKATAIGARVAAINWYRASIGEAGNARKLIELCRRNLADVPACLVDLATYYRYTRNQQALADVVSRAMHILQRPLSGANYDDFYYDRAALPPIARRLVTALIDQPMAEDLAELNENLAQAQQAELNANAAASEEDVDATPEVGDASPTANAASRVTTPPSALSAGTTQPELADKLLRWMLKQPGAMPIEAAGVAVAFSYLLPDVNIESVLQEGAKAQIPAASLYLGRLYGLNQRVPRNARLSEASLLEALRFRETAASAHERLGRLYQLGYLGRPDPQQALDHMLYAARRRVAVADKHLARLFYDSPGVRIDRVSSYVFARLSEDSGTPVVIHSLRNGTLSAYRLLDRLRDELTPEELRKAEALYQQERAVHLVTQPPVAPDVWVKGVG